MNKIPFRLLFPFCIDKQDAKKLSSRTAVTNTGPPHSYFLCMKYQL